MNRKVRAAQKYKSRMWRRQQETQNYNDKVEYKRSQKAARSEYKTGGALSRSWQKVSRQILNHSMPM
jgi:hypothetical protein